MANETRDFDALFRQIQSLNIEVSQGHDGVLTVCSTAEPLFCYDAVSEDEASALVEDTLRSYARHFYHIEDFDVTATMGELCLKKDGPNWLPSGSPPR